MSFVVLVWEDGNDPVVYGPTNEKWATKAYQAIEKAQGWDMNNPHSFATIAELKSVTEVSEDWGPTKDEIWSV